jgi:hypothetical protein
MIINPTMLVRRGSKPCGINPFRLTTIHRLSRQATTSTILPRRQVLKDQSQENKSISPIQPGWTQKQSTAKAIYLTPSRRKDLTHLPAGMFPTLLNLKELAHIPESIPLKRPLFLPPQLENVTIINPTPYPFRETQRIKPCTSPIRLSPEVKAQLYHPAATHQALNSRDKRITDSFISPIQ